MTRADIKKYLDTALDSISGYTDNVFVGKFSVIRQHIARIKELSTEHKRRAAAVPPQEPVDMPREAARNEYKMADALRRFVIAELRALDEYRSRVVATARVMAVGVKDVSQLISSFDDLATRKIGSRRAQAVAMEIPLWE